MREIITGTSKDLYDMIIKFHDDVFKHKKKDFLIKTKVEDDTDIELFQDFISLIEDIREDWDGDIKVDFEIEGL